MQDLEDRCSGEALTVAQANLAAAHDQVSQLHTQLQQAQARASAMSNAEAQVSQLQAQLQLQRSANKDKATAVAALTAGVQQERDSWQQERLTLLGRAKVTNACLCKLRSVHTDCVFLCKHRNLQTTMPYCKHTWTVCLVICLVVSESMLCNSNKLHLACEVSGSVSQSQRCPCCSHE